jgi:hypothetical protein
MIGSIVFEIDERKGLKGLRECLPKDIPINPDNLQKPKSEKTFDDGRRMPIAYGG